MSTKNGVVETSDLGQISDAIMAGIERPSISASAVAERVQALRAAFRDLAEAGQVCRHMVKQSQDGTLRYEDGRVMALHLASTSAKTNRIPSWENWAKMAGKMLVCYAAVASHGECIAAWESIQADRLEKGLVTTPWVHLAERAEGHLAAHVAYRAAVEASKDNKPVKEVTDDSPC